MSNEENDSPRIIRLEETDSTNNYLRNYLREQTLPEGSVIVTHYQTAGKGQPGNSWESRKDENLLFSSILYPECIPANRQFIISQVAALSVQETLSAYTGDICVKWPNDVYWKDRKICGMLIENDLTGSTMYCSVIGIGINLNQMQFTSPAPNPVSLKQITGVTYDPEEILQAFLHHFYRNYLTVLEDKEELIRKRYRDVLYRNNGFHSYKDDDGIFRATIRDIEPTGHLVLEKEDGSIRRYAFKEVTFLHDSFS